MRRIRVGVVILGCIAGFATVGTHLYRIQIEEGGRYRARAESQHERLLARAAERGTVYFTDKYGNDIPAAINKEFPVVFAVPKEIVNPEEAAREAANLFGLDEDVLREKFSKPGEYQRLVVKASDELVAKARAARLPGIYIDTEKARLYPFGELAAHLLGFVGASERDDAVKGRYGIERSFEDVLAGGPLAQRRESVDAFREGSDVRLTIDRNIQARAEAILKNLVNRYEASSGTVIVEEVRSGRILALGNSPTFDPNRYSAFPVAAYLNPAVETVYEPGSIFKVVTLAAGLDLGAITRETTFTDTGSLTLNGKTITNAGKKTYGKVSMADVISHSVNLGAAHVERLIGHERFRAYVERFGFGELLEVPLPGEVKSNVRGLGKGARDIQFATASFGQGIAVTPLALLQAVAAIANDGIRMKPLMLLDEEPQPQGRVVGREAAREMADMLIRSVEENVVAAIPGYSVAGKTGTAQIPDFKRGGYTGEFIHNYAGFVPAGVGAGPRYAILIKLDRPQGVELAGYTVVPAFRELAEFIIHYYELPPDKLVSGSRPAEGAE